MLLVWQRASAAVDLFVQSCFPTEGAMSLLQLHLLFYTSGWDLRVKCVWSGSSELGVRGLSFTFGYDGLFEELGHVQTCRNTPVPCCRGSERAR